MIDLTKGISKKESFGNNNWEKSNQALHIAFGIDENFAAPMGVTMTSIVDKNQGEEIVFHVFADSIKQIDVERLQKFASIYEVQVILYHMDVEYLEKGFNLSWRAVYNRFLAAKCLDDKIKRVLYIDADMICLGSLQELNTIDFEGNLAMVVHDQGSVDGYIKELSLKNGKYFNAGMLYIDIDAWNKEQISERSMELLTTRKLFLLDQDALNILLDGKAKYLPYRWNYMCNMEKRKSKISADTVIVHYASINKPWYSWCFHHARMPWIEYYHKSLWNDFQFRNNPRNYREMRMMCMYMLHENRYKEAVQWFIRYYKQRKLEKNQQKGVSL